LPNPFKIVRIYPHDREAFTQGLAYAGGGILYEGTGLNGRSLLRKVELASGRVLKEAPLPAIYFGEGITLWQDRILQLTWRNQVGFVYDRDTFRLLRQFGYPHEGWGITQDGRKLIVSDGTAVLHFLDPGDYRETGNVLVHDERGPVKGLNELEYVRGVVYANLWPTDDIVVIDPATGLIQERIGLKGLLRGREAQGADVLNGIAYDSRGDRLFITGKFWPKLFEIRRGAP
jgi:glutamine cyclotransferase